MTSQPKLASAYLLCHLTKFEGNNRAVCIEKRLGRLLNLWEYFFVSCHICHVHVIPSITMSFKTNQLFIIFIEYTTQGLGIKLLVLCFGPL